MFQVTGDESARVKETLTDKRLRVKYGPGDDETVDMFGELGNKSRIMMVYLSGDSMKI